MNLRHEIQYVNIPALTRQIAVIELSHTITFVQYVDLSSNYTVIWTINQHIGRFNVYSDEDGILLITQREQKPCDPSVIVKPSLVEEVLIRPPQALFEACLRFPSKRAARAAVCEE